MERVGRPSRLLRLTKVGCLLAVLVAAEYAVLRAYWYHSLRSASENGPLLPIPPVVGFSGLLLVGIVAVAWAAERGPLGDRAGSLLGAGLVLLLFAWIAAPGFVETAGQAQATGPRLDLFSWHYSMWVEGRTPSVELHGAGAEVHVPSLPLAGGHLLLAGGLWFESWTDEKVTALALTVESYRGASI